MTAQLDTISLAKEIKKMPESAKKLESEWRDIMSEIRVTDALYDEAKKAFDDFWNKKKSALWTAANKKREALLAALEADK